MLIITALLMSIFLRRIFSLYNFDFRDSNHKIQRRLDTQREIPRTKLKMDDAER